MIHYIVPISRGYILWSNHDILIDQLYNSWQMIYPIDIGSGELYSQILLAHAVRILHYIIIYHNIFVIILH